MITAPHVLQVRREQRPDLAAVVTSGGAELTYAALDERSDVVARSLVARGLSVGDRVAIAFRNSEALEHVIAYFGVQKAGGAVVPLNPRAPQPEARAVLDDCDARFVVAGQTLGDGLREVAGARIVAFAELTSEVEAALPALGEQDLAEVIYTSGTPGVPKSVAMPHRNAVGVYDGRPSRTAGLTFLNPVPLHTYAGTAFLLGSVKSGMTNLVMDGFDAARFASLLERRDVVSAYAVSPMWVRVLKDVPDLADRDFSHIRIVSFGAAAMPVWAVQRLGELFGRALIQNIYGLTEGGPAVCRLRPGDHLRKPGSVGRPVGDTEVRIVEGEIQLRMRGVPNRSYFGDAEATSEVFTDDGWIRTGDIGRVDDDGYLYIVDRAKDVIITGGNNVSSAEVEAALSAHPAVAEVAVIGAPDPDRGERVTAVIVLRDEAGAEDLRGFAAERLAAYKVPREIRFMDVLPRNAVGKVTKHVLRTGGHNA